MEPTMDSAARPTACAVVPHGSCRQTDGMNRIAIRITALAWIAALLFTLPAAAQEATPPPAIPVEPVEAVPLAPPPAREFVGIAVVLDGRTVEVAGQVLRLYGLAGYGSDWRAEAAARVALDSLVAGIELKCVEAGRDRNRRLLALCQAAEIDVGEAMIGAGMALVDRSVTRADNADTALAGRYDAAAAAARRSSAGLWATVPGFEPPPPVEPTPPPLTIWDKLERFQAGIAVLAGFVIVAVVIWITGRRQRKAAAGG